MAMTNRASRATARTKAKIARDAKLPFIEHVHELRRRLFIVAACVAIGSTLAYGIQRQIIAALLRPSHGQNFIYTSPLGGINFLFSVCLDIGLVLSTPVIIYQLLAFVSPLMRDTTQRFLRTASAAAGGVALAGVVFGYFVGLPSALHFLLHQFTTIQVRPLITIQSYMQFVALYLLGSALMFQLPLIFVIINRIKPIKPSGLFKYERHLIAGAFIVAFIMNPTPNLLGQMIVVVPIILMYQFGIILIWAINRSNARPSWLQPLIEQDTKRQIERADRPLVPYTEPVSFAPVINHNTTT
ncbi:MAG TPA: twin-arginine translocase subunit TatC [Verrucomicrobiae bacterium]|nr:twin-arginine translocase subunit TatC [Verrucomicrobiae bacterium]